MGDTIRKKRCGWTSLLNAYLNATGLMPFDSYTMVSVDDAASTPSVGLIHRLSIQHKKSSAIKKFVSDKTIYRSNINKFIV